MNKQNILIPKKEINLFCQRWKIKRLELFGSALTEEFSPDSDIDLLVDYNPGFQRTLADMLLMQQELEELLQRPVDLVTRQSIERSPNPYKKKNILEHTVLLYG